jgi:ADP-ribose pyrophosphatase
MQIEKYAGGKRMSGFDLGLLRADPAQLREEKISGELIFEGRVLRLEVDQVRLPNGNTSGREVIRHVGAVAILPLTDAGEVIVEEQFRYPHGEIFLEIPAGKLDSADEDPRLAAARELREETGYTAERLIELGEFVPSPAILGERTRLYLAMGLRAGESKLDEDEFLSVRRMPLDTLVDAVLSGRIPDGKTQTAILRVAMMRQRGMI